MESGFSIEEGVISERECVELLEGLSKNQVTRTRAGARHLMANPRVAALASDERLLHIAGHALSSRPAPFRATLFEKSARANWMVVWHQDTALPLTSRFDSAEWGPWSIKAGIHYAHAPTWALSRVVALRVHLDASRSENGPLRVIPGSHRAGVLSDDEVFHLAKTQKSVECVVRRGGVLAMRPLLIHSSTKACSADPRRVLHIEYADSLDFGSNIHLAVA